MTKSIQIATKIKHFFQIFDKRTYDTFKSVVSSLIFLRNTKQADIANFSSKGLHQIQYFFHKAVWDFKILNTLRLQWIRNKIAGAGDKKSDILLLDSTIIEKSKYSTFSGLTSYFFSNKSKKIVNGFDIFGASIITESGIKYILDICLYFKKNKLKLSNNDKRNPSVQNMLWIRFITKLLKITKSWLVVMDAGFKGGYIEKLIFTVCKRHFLVRVGLEQSYYDSKLNEFKIKDFLKVENSISVNGMNLRVIKNVMLKSWFKKGIKLETNLIIYHKKGFYKPAILCTSADIGDIYENMFRKVGDLSWKEKLKQLFSDNALLKAKSENEIYFSFILLYEKRWSIEVCFRELKTYLGFEKFQVQDYNAIMKYLHICILIHSVLYITLSYIYLDISLKSLIYETLKKKRNIKNDYFNISFDGLKLFLEMSVFDTIFSFKKLSFSISLNSCLAFTNQIKLD